MQLRAISRKKGRVGWSGALLLGVAILLALPVSHSHAAPGWRQRRQFLATLRREMSALEQGQKAQEKALKQAQKALRAKTEADAGAERRECFKQATRGSEKRTCVQALLERRKSLSQQLKQEKKALQDQNRADRQRLEQEHRRRLADFDHGGTGAPVPAASPSPGASPAASSGPSQN